jgi:hypothetical protein
MAALFDAYIMVDWSAASKPATGPNSIWIGMLMKDARLKLQFKAVNIDTRLKARAFIEDIVAKLIKRGDKVLLGFDFSLGYPAGTAAALGLDTSKQAPWAAMHAMLASRYKDKPDNNSRPRFAIAAGLNYIISKGPSRRRPARRIPPRRIAAARKTGRFAEILLATLRCRLGRLPKPNRHPACACSEASLADRAHLALRDRRRRPADR